MTEDPCQKRRMAADDFMRSLGQLESVLNQDETAELPAVKPSTTDKSPAADSQPLSPAERPSSTARGPREEAPRPVPSLAEALEAAAADIEAFMNQGSEGI